MGTIVPTYFCITPKEHDRCSSVVNQLCLTDTTQALVFSFEIEEKLIYSKVNNIQQWVLSSEFFFQTKLRIVLHRYSPWYHYDLSQKNHRINSTSKIKQVSKTHFLYPDLRPRRFIMINAVRLTYLWVKS